MKLDIRIPLGMLFALYGVILAVYGLATSPEVYRKSLNINVNLWWGLALLAFGLIMLLIARMGAKKGT